MQQLVTPAVILMGVIRYVALEIVLMAATQRLVVLRVVHAALLFAPLITHSHVAWAAAAVRLRLTRRFQKNDLAFERCRKTGRKPCLSAFLSIWYVL